MLFFFKKKLKSKSKNFTNFKLISLIRYILVNKFLYDKYHLPNMRTNNEKLLLSKMMKLTVLSLNFAIEWLMKVWITITELETWMSRTLSCTIKALLETLLSTAHWFMRLKESQCWFLFLLLWPFWNPI